MRIDPSETPRVTVWGSILAWTIALRDQLRRETKDHRAVTVAVLALALLSGTCALLTGHDFFICLFLICLVCEFTCGYSSEKWLFMFGLALATNLFARIIHAVDSTPGQFYYQISAIPFLVALAGLLGVAISSLSSIRLRKISAEPERELIIKVDYCPKCGKSCHISVNANTECPSCDLIFRNLVRRKADVIACKKCGNSIYSLHRFCSRCGAEAPEVKRKGVLGTRNA